MYWLEHLNDKTCFSCNKELTDLAIESYGHGFCNIECFHKIELTDLAIESYGHGFCNIELYHNKTNKEQDYFKNM